jgi:hypothetical protein
LVSLISSSLGFPALIPSVFCYFPASLLGLPVLPFPLTFHGFPVFPFSPAFHRFPSAPFYPTFQFFPAFSFISGPLSVITVIAAVISGPGIDLIGRSVTAVAVNISLILTVSLMAIYILSGIGPVVTVRALNRLTG